MMERWPFWPTLALICFLTLSGCDGKERNVFTIDQVKLTLLPGTMVERGSNVTLRCEVKVSHSSSQLMHTLMFLMDESVIYSKNTSEAVVEYNLAPARASHSGLYKCQVQILKKEKSSRLQRLSVTGLQTPQLKVQPSVVNEGDEVVATCSAPEEIGSLNIYFYKNNQELHIARYKSNSATITVKVQEPGNISLHCKYMLLLYPSAGHSNNSNIVNIFVQELQITPSIKILPNAIVVEGDQVDIICNVSDYSQSGLEVFLTKDTVLYKGHQSFSHSFVVRANDSGEYVCKTERGNVQKSSKAQLQVAELFSRPILTMTPKYVFEEQRFNLSCSISETQITSTDVKYSIYKDKKHLKVGQVFSGLASKASSGSYYCKAEAKGINKTSMPLVINVKVPVSAPVIHTVGKIIKGKPFQLQCESEHGTLPINYTLLKFQEPVAHMTVTGPQHSALFNISSISSRNESHSFICLAENQGPLHRKSSLSLNTPVIETVSPPELTLWSYIKTKVYMVTEGVTLILNCSVQQGTVPITFTWYRKGVVNPLNSTQISKTQGSHIIKPITHADEGIYFCQASNDANETKKSHSITIEVTLAGWKKALIGVSCIFLLVLIVLILVIFLKKAHTPQKNKRAVELSVKPTRTKSDDPMRVSLTLDIEDNTASNATPGIMGRNVWSDNASSSEFDEESKKEESEQSEHADEPSLQNVDSGEELVMHETDTVKHDFQDITQDETDQVGTDLEYVQLNNCELEPETLHLTHHM
ncbi:platelet endothelial cell adhesion molecule isoform X3 [Neoarius graeffei]|uniref:platelet endothelial cell adhesion molecule isoform X3 n=1 Tax=Neoarius graeffei TaxID=443677 RepID=UPI00298C2BFC|nr:platelet endothelial cell adhesion molecule isoform X3 [Neoarius graeffei]